MGRGRGWELRRAPSIARCLQSQADWRYSPMSVFNALDAEWEGLTGCPVRGEGADICAEAGVSDLAHLLAHVRRATPAESDIVMAALVRRAAAGSDLAARVLLQLLLPATRRLATRWWALGDYEERA